MNTAVRRLPEIVVDNFAGGGGASTGIEIAIGHSVDVAINHDPAAIAMHRANREATEVKMGGDKAVLISIKPEWCAYICDEKKDTEVRKNIPSLQCPFKVYIYCTKHGDKTELSRMYGDGKARRMIGKVIGEFVCDHFTCIQVRHVNNGIHLGNTAFLRTCLYDAELIEYLTNGMNVDAEGWGWHISKLKIYADPRELTWFHYYGRPKRINRPPQSWCYVEVER